MNNLLLTLIKTNIIYKKKICKINYSKKNYLILKQFLKLNLIKSIRLSNDKINSFMYINLNFYTNLNIIKKIILFSKSKLNVLTSNNAIKKLKLTNIYIISTSKGVCSNFFCLKNNLGGLIICKIVI